MCIRDRFEVVDLIKPEPMKGIARVEEVSTTVVTKKPTTAVKKPTVKKDTRYNPFKDGRTPTSASQTTGP